MKNNKKNWFAITLAILVIALLVRYIFKNKDENESNEE